MTLPQVVSEDPNLIVAEMVKSYEAMTGKTLYPAQIERLMIDLIAYRETLVRADINDAARQGLVDFAREPMLSYLGARVDTYRLAPKPARTTLRFSVESPVLSAFAIPNLPRISSPTNTLFVPVKEPIIQPGQTYVEVTAEAQEAGSLHNGIFPDSIKEPFDSLPEGVSVTNVSTSSAGADQEGIERFRERVKLAQSRPGAGSPKQYRYLAMSADVSVIDVSVTVIAPGHVRIAILTPQGDDPAEIVAAVYKAVNRSDVKPTTDNVDVVAATSVSAPLLIAVTPRKTALVSVVQAAAESAVLAHSRFLARKLGYDVVRSEIESMIQNKGGIKRVVTEGADVSISPSQYAILGWELSLTEAEDD